MGTKSKPIVMLIASFVGTLIFISGLMNLTKIENFKIQKKSLVTITTPAVRRCLSFSFFGKTSWAKYGSHIQSVAREAKASKLYKNWLVRVYHDNLDENIQVNLSKAYSNLEFHDVRKLVTLNLTLIKKEVKNINSINAMTWRFIPMADETIDIFCSRDLDSPILQREEDAVEEWLQSGKIMHVMRDYPQHGTFILGGLWCFRNEKDRIKGQATLKLLLDNAGKRSNSSEAMIGNDQDVLSKFMWPLIKNDTMQHDSYLCHIYPGSIPFPSKRYGGTFVGCRRPCNYEQIECPEKCRSKDHNDWKYC